MAKKKPPRNAAGKHQYASRGASRGRSGTPSGSHARPKPANVTPNRQRGFRDGERPYDYAFYESEPATPEYMARLFAGHGFPVDARQLDKFWLYYDLLRRRNAELDLTRIMGIEATVLKHFIDSAMILRWFEPSGPVLDIGSGPGFPGLPLAIMRPGVRFVLGESRGKRVTFLEEAIKTLKLTNVEIFPKSVREDSPLGDDHGRPIGDIVTRALETIPPTLERVLPFVKAGSRVVFMKGPGCDEEIEAANRAFEGVYTLSGDQSYVLPGTDQGRRLVLYTKCAFEA